MRRRLFLGGLAAAIAAPAIVARENIMAIKIIDEVPPLASPTVIEFIEQLRDELDRRDRLLRTEIGQIDRFTIYVDHAMPGADRIVFWQPPVPTAREVEAKRAEAFRQLRQWLEPKRSRRWV